MSSSTITVSQSVATPWQPAEAEDVGRLGVTPIPPESIERTKREIDRQSDLATERKAARRQRAEESIEDDADGVYEITPKGERVSDYARQQAQQRDRRFHRKQIALVGELLGHLDLNSLVRVTEMLAESRVAPPVPRVQLNTNDAEVRARVLIRTAGLLAGISRGDLSGWRRLLEYVTTAGENPANALNDVVGGRLFPRY